MRARTTTPAVTTPDTTPTPAVTTPDIAPTTAATQTHTTTGTPGGTSAMTVRRTRGSAGGSRGAAGSAGTTGMAGGPAGARTVTAGAAAGRVIGSGRTTAPVRDRRRAARLRLLAAGAAAVLAFPLGAAFPAGAASPRAVAGVRIWQGGPAAVYGGADPVVDSYLVQLPASVQGRVAAVVAFAPGQFPAGTGTAQVAAHLHSTCAVGDGAYQPCAWQGGPSPRGDLDGWLRLQLPAADAAGTLQYRIRIQADAGTLPADRLLTGWMELSGEDGTVLGDGVAQMRYSTGLPDPADRGQMYAVDTGGVLWRYEGTGSSTVPLRPRAKVGRGWDAYDAITPLAGTTAGGSGEVVARDTGGVLWFYGSSGNTAQPFAPRLRVGAGWNIYTAITGVGTSGYAQEGLVARDRQGVLWFYRRSWSDPGAVFEPRVRVGAGWNVYNALSTYGGGIVGRTADGHLWSYSRHPGDQPVFDPRVDAGPGWGGYTAFSPLFVSTDNPHALAARDSSGQLWLLSDRDGTAQIPAGPRLVGAGWNIYTRLF